MPVPRRLRQLRVQDLLAQHAALRRDRQLPQGEVRQVRCKGMQTRGVYEYYVDADLTFYIRLIPSLTPIVLILIL